VAFSPAFGNNGFLGQASDHGGNFHAGSVQGAKSPSTHALRGPMSDVLHGDIRAAPELPLTSLLSVWLMRLVSRQLWSCPQHTVGIHPLGWWSFSS